ncbi:hypothetical protein DVK85_01290 [Flavobacterium arcticum]|uniref:Uncharacterized protein n=1 Tax=Flavobacterium arcticum TaxID=1784713 RepID=A0A345H8M6_9FLAO|nr:hypothetical protein [Flavobacterium arcticum]AXG72936.1 hypothetical protein DVK85_01290 [Flavobacterium arcticum]KAF2510400.1 hypothetical protein E0W72_07915 [Flavobacterium arcticum]
MILTAKNGKQYTVTNGSIENLEIQCDNKVFVFEDLSIGNYSSRKKEAVFYSYDIVEGERINKARHSVKDFNSEYLDFLKSNVWESLQNDLVTALLKKVEFTEIQE